MISKVEAKDNKTKIYRQKRRDVLDLKEIKKKLIAEERRRIAQELHDGLAQSLFSFTLDLQVCIKQLSADPEITKKKLKNLQKEVSQNLKELRRYIYNLRPQVAKEISSTEFLRLYVNQLAKANFMKIDFQAIGEEKTLSSKAKDCLAKVTHEAIINSVKHAQAKNLIIRLKFDEDKVALLIKDNGSGFDVKKIFQEVDERKTFGILGMRERVKSLDGQFHLNSEIGEGTKIKVSLPY